MEIFVAALIVLVVLGIAASRSRRVGSRGPDSLVEGTPADFRNKYTVGGAGGGFIGGGDGDASGGGGIG
jgi:hypothetical protein